MLKRFIKAEVSDIALHKKPVNGTYVYDNMESFVNLGSFNFLSKHRKALRLHLVKIFIYLA